MEKVLVYKNNSTEESQKRPSVNRGNDTTSTATYLLRQNILEEESDQSIIEVIIGQSASLSIGSVNTISEYPCKFISINSLTNLQLSSSLSAIVEFEDEICIARCIDIPLYAEGGDIYDAISNLKDEIEALFLELQEDDDFSEEWLNYKRFLNSRVILRNG